MHTEFRVKCVISTNHYKKGTRAMQEKSITFLKTGSHAPSYETVQQDIAECPTSFFDNISNYSPDIPDGRYDLIPCWTSGGYEYPNECSVEYLLERDNNA